ncbi:YitT family protein [Paracerasibacillus soli]|uniref:YitT family protein n=1 Tax=Paracerasibacillus soli TaxID=480284 RepID=A0ABU5CNR9_9BACI|nr:YitT family protein [Virgibacillus soli]MDY0408004.1 YitT family protein [Virgibacillus soli]
MQHEIKKGLLVILGGSLQGLGMGLFLFPQSIPSGGAGGITIIIHYLLNIPVGIALWIVNFSLIFLGITYLGKRFALWTFIGITITSMTVHFIENLILLPNRNLIIDIVFGSIFLGTGIGIPCVRVYLMAESVLLQFYLHIERIFYRKTAILHELFHFFRNGCHC